MRRLPDPKIVRLSNRLTDGHAFSLIVLTLVGLGVLVGAWALAVGSPFQERVPIVVPSSADPSPQGTLASPIASLSVSVAPASSAVVPSPSEPPRRYFVRSGDTLAKIAGRLYGDESLWPLILEANRDQVDDPQLLTTGTGLWIPDPPNP